MKTTENKVISRVSGDKRTGKRRKMHAVEQILDLKTWG
jgi:hypothetical protein